ncbi:hypothetical protein PIIN_07680 [Serendipita indica DSM 11827]|uniref:Uncharacterized protein n=1 Tax=Serendipita indica (strain DSM 11827) TaxID=1109443 RepID=G4TQY2_SERID|nr:hypothetical protein PIIN_07680 [Serendipita indica DSM 11827]
MSKVLPGRGSWPSSESEDILVKVQTVATSAGGLGILFISAVPAMYRLNLLSPDPKSDFGRLITLTVA